MVVVSTPVKLFLIVFRSSLLSFIVKSLTLPQLDLSLSYN